jgi:hypothetical protein
MVYAGESEQLSARGCQWVGGEEHNRCQIEANQWGAGAHLWDWVLRTKQQVSSFGGVADEDWVRVWFDRASVLRLWPPVPSDASIVENEKLGPAPDAEIKLAISAEYDEAEKSQRKPPNVKEIASPVQARLRDKGFHASGNYIQQIADAPEHKARRRPRGRTVASEKRGHKR